MNEKRTIELRETTKSRITGRGKTEHGDRKAVNLCAVIRDQDRGIARARNLALDMNPVITWGQSQNAKRKMMKLASRTRATAHRMRTA